MHNRLPKSGVPYTHCPNLSRTAARSSYGLSRCTFCLSMLEYFLSSSCSPSTKVPYDEVPPSRIIRWEELEKESAALSKGANGVVYKAKWRGKYDVIMKRALGNSDELFREAETMSKLTPHDNVVQLYGVTADPHGQPYLVVELVRFADEDAPPDLAYLIANGKGQWDAKQKLAILVDAARGMGHLHEHKIVHRDLAARNILISSHGHAKIGDFGLSRFMVDGRHELSKPTALPTRWMPPESLTEPFIATEKSDVWAFACTAWELFAGVTPYDGKLEGKELAEAIKAGSLRLDWAGCDSCPEALRSIFGQCCARNPRTRPTFRILLNLIAESYITDLRAQISEVLSLEASVGDDLCTSAARALYGLDNTHIDKEMGAQLMQLAAKLGHTGARGLCAMNGWGRAQDKEEGFRLLRSASASGDLFSLWKLGQYYVKGCDVEGRSGRAVSLFEALAEQGYAPGLSSLGTCYFRGIGVTKDVGKAAELFERAARRGFVEAIFNLASILREEDDVRAAAHMLQAAEMGHVLSMRNVALYYKKGVGLPVDQHRAKEWLRKWKQFTSQTGASDEL